MAQTLKIKLKSGAREIEIEGQRADVDALLEAWWSNDGAVDRGQATADSESPLPRSKSGKSGKRPRLPRKEAASENEEPEQLNANGIANQIKESERFDLITQKILHATGDYYNKAAFVCWFVNAPLTSGQVHKVLIALHVRVVLPRISEAFKKNMGSFITSGTRGVGKAITYQLTSKARADFEKWLEDRGE